MKRFKNILAVILTLVICTSSCANSRRVVAESGIRGINEYTFPSKANSVYDLRKNIDLGGKTYHMPSGVTLKGRGGVIKNGTLIGQDTKIESKTAVFDRVTIKGDWIVPDISTKLFKDLDYDNSLRDVMALTNDKIVNKVTIHKGVYYFKFFKDQETGIYIRSNTSVTLNGELKLKPNSFTSYSIVQMTGMNCSLNGIGIIIGDKMTHTGKSGEWGMGVEFSKANNSSISGITIKDCWGDCIYVGNESKNVTIKNCALDNGRRQGISITSADSVWVRDCIISNVSGTNPQFAIDVEPNKNMSCTNIYINNVQAINCVGGFVVSGIAQNAIVKGIHLSNCIVRGATSKYPLTLYMANDVTVEGCDVDSESEYTVLIEKTTSVNARNNIFRAKGKKHFNKIYSKELDIENNQLIIKK